jgi:hypothetical protein
MNIKKRIVAEITALKYLLGFEPVEIKELTCQHAFSLMVLDRHYEVLECAIAKAPGFWQPKRADLKLKSDKGRVFRCWAFKLRGGEIRNIGKGDIIHRKKANGNLYIDRVTADFGGVLREYDAPTRPLAFG